MLPAGLSPWCLLPAGVGALAVLGWLVAAPNAVVRAAALAPLAGLMSCLALAAGLLGAAAQSEPAATATGAIAVSLLPVLVALAAALALQMRSQPPVVAAAPSAPAPGGSSGVVEAKLDALSKKLDRPASDAHDTDLVEALRQLTLAQPDEVTRLSEVLEPLQPVLETVHDAATALQTGVDGLAADREAIRELLEAWRQEQGPALTTLGEAGGTLKEASGDLGQLLRLVMANQQLTADGLESVCQRLTSAGERLESAATEWGGLVRSGLAESREFSRQAIEALLAGLERSPDELTGIPEAARDATAQADAAEAKMRAAAGELAAVADTFQEQLDSLAARVELQLKGAVEAVDATALAGLKASLDSLRGTQGQLTAALGKLDPAFGSLAQLGSLTTALTSLQQSLEKTAGQVGWSWPAKIGAGLVLLYVLATLGLASGLFERL